MKCLPINIAMGCYKFLNYEQRQNIGCSIAGADSA